MTKKINWRLKSLPTTEELQNLVKDGILTKEEAREILFSQEDEKDRGVKSLEAEIKFLRELVSKLSENRSQIITTIEKVYPRYHNYDWYKPYAVWCNAGNLTSSGTGVVMGLATGGSSGTMTYTNVTGFNEIQTF